MAYSNWAGISNWTVVDDPTGVLNGKTLKAEGPKDSDKAEVLIQNIGTNVTFNINNYEIVCNYAFQKDWEFNGGKFLLTSRTSYSGSNLTQYYGAGFDLLRGTVFIILFNGVTTEVLKISQLYQKYVSREFNHEMKLSVTGTDIVTINLTIDNELVLSASDVNAVISSGFPALLVSRGTIYIDNFSINRYTIDGNEPTDWEFSEDFTNFSTEVETWLSSNTGSKTVTSTTDANGNALSLIDSWVGIDSNTTTATSTGNNRPNKVTQNNFDVGEFFRTVTTRTRGSSSNGIGGFYSGSIGSGNVGFFREGTQYITGSSDVGQNNPITVSFWIKFMNTSSTSGAIFCMFDKSTYSSGAGANQRSVEFTMAQDGTMEFSQRMNDDSSLANQSFYSASAFTLNTWYNIKIIYYGNAYNWLITNIATKVAVYINGAEQTASSITARNPYLTVDKGSTASSNSIMILANDPRSSSSTFPSRIFISNFIFINNTTTVINTDDPLELTTNVSSSTSNIYIPFRILEIENQFLDQSLKILDRKGTVNLENSSFNFAFKTSPQDNADLVSGTGTNLYFGSGLNYRPHIATDKPTGGTRGSLFYGRITTQSGNRAMIPNGSTYNFAEGNAISFSFWLYLDTTISRNPDRIFTARSSSTEVFKFNLKQGIKFEIISVDASSDTNTLVYDSYTPNTAGWYNIVITWNGTAANLNSNANLYINGVAQTPSSTTINNTTNSLPTVDEFIFFSSDSSGSDAPDDIYVHSIHVFNTELSSGSVTTIYNSGTYQDVASATNQYLFVDDTQTNNLLLDDSSAIVNDYANSNSLLQIADNFVDSGTVNVMATVPSFSTSALTGLTPSAGTITVTTTNFPNSMNVPHNTNLNLNSSGGSVFFIGYSTNVGLAEQILIQKGSSYKLKIELSRLIFDNGSEHGSTSTVKLAPQLSILSFITNDGIYVNGTKVFSLTGITVGSDNTDDLYIGADSSTTESTSLRGYVGEVIIISRELSNQDRQYVEGYFSHKWGINNLLPSDHPYLLEEPYKGDS